MKTRFLMVIALAMAGSFSTSAQDAKAVLDSAAQALGADKVNAIQFSARGLQFEVGQAAAPDAPWPRFRATSYLAAIDYRVPFMRQDLYRAQGENPPRGGGPQPIAAEQRQATFVSGKHAWNAAGPAFAPAMAAVNDRLLQLWMTPHGFIKAAQTNNATVRTETAGGRKVTVVSFTLLGRHKVNGTLNEQNLVERVETWIDNPVLGDMHLEMTYSDYKEFGTVKFPMRIAQKQGGHPSLDLTVNTVGLNNVATPPVPENVVEATPVPMSAHSFAAANGVWYLTGSTHHSVAVEFRDHVVVIEAPLSEERSLAVIAEVKRIAPTKPIRYLINTHQHFDHLGGVRAYAAEGVTIITQEMNKPYYEKIFAAARTLNPDRLAQSKRKVAIEGVADRRVLTDGDRTLEIYRMQGNGHNDGMLVVYLPREKMLVEADMWNPPAAPVAAAAGRGAPGGMGGGAPLNVNPFSANLYDNIERLKLDVRMIAGLHGRLGMIEELRRVIGRDDDAPAAGRGGPGAGANQ